MTEERRRIIGKTEYIEGKIPIQYRGGEWSTENCIAAIQDGVSAHGERHDRPHRSVLQAGEGPGRGAV